MKADAKERAYQARRYSKELQKESDLRFVELRARDSQLTVFLFLSKLYPRWITFTALVWNLKGRITRRPVWKALGELRDDGVVDRRARVRIPNAKGYRHTVYRLNLSKYQRRHFEHNAKSRAMKALEQYPNILYGMALTMGQARGKEPKVRDAFFRSFIDDPGVQRDLQELFRREGELYTLKRRLEGKA